MVKKRNVAAEVQLLIQPKRRECHMGEDYKELEQRFSDFILEVEKGLNEGGMSGAEGKLGVLLANFDLVKAQEVEKEI